MAIRIFITGGTFDKEYNELNGQLYFKDTHLSDLLETIVSRFRREGATVELISSPLPGSVKLKPLAIERAIGNLIGNITGIGRPPEPQAPVAAPPAPAPVQPAPAPVVAPAPAASQRSAAPAPQPTSGTVIPY